MSSAPPIKLIALGVIAVTVIIGGIVFVTGGFGSNNYENWQIKQSVSGSVEVIDSPGYYPKWFATVWTYPRAVQTFYSQDRREQGADAGDDSIDVTFNDGGNAQVSAMVRYNTPTKSEQRLQMHQDFSGNIHNVTQAVRAHLVNCLKNSAPIMSASEHQSARKAEFNTIVEEQFRHGLYEMRKVNRVLKDQFDESGKPITVYATEIVLDKEGKPIIVFESPLKDYGIEIGQFSITGTEYDPKTREQFSAKKESFLAAEKSKAQREQEVQQRLMTQEKGLREKAEVEAKSNMEMAQAVIEATKKVRVAEQAKAEAEMVANQKLEVARIEKQEALTRASRELEVAQIRTKASEQEALAIKTLAEAQKEKIAMGGAITEKERVLAEIAAERDAKVAAHLANIKVPSIMFGGQGGTGQSGSNDWQAGMWNLIMLRAAGIDISKETNKVSPFVESEKK